MSNHAFLSPSSSHRWLNCTPSAVLESKFENKSTKASEEGTVAHAWCEHKLKTILRRRSDEPISHYTNNEMQEYTDLYVDFVLEQFNLAKQKCKDPLILIEQKVDFSEYVPNGFGTADCIIVSESKIHIIDFKCTRSNVALVDDVAILADHDLRVGACNATNDGGIAFL